MEDVVNSYYVQIVTQGAAQLDEAVPGWEREIDLSKLDMHSCTDCILGQVGQRFFNQMGAARVDVVAWKMPDGTFQSPWGWMKERFDLAENGAFAADAVREVWVDLIKERFNTGALSDA